MVTVAVPITAGVFIYEVSALRDAQLQHEAVDRTRHDAASPFPNKNGLPKDGGEPPVAAAADLSGRLDTMLSHRAALLDTFGDEGASVAPVYASIIKRMLKDDDAAFALLKARREDGTVQDPAPLAQKELSLHAAHARLAKLVGF